jgi:hypothetical protein
MQQKKLANSMITTIYDTNYFGQQISCAPDKIQDDSIPRILVYLIHGCAVIHLKETRQHHHAV